MGAKVDPSKRRGYHGNHPPIQLSRKIKIKEEKRRYLHHQQRTPSIFSFRFGIKLNTCSKQCDRDGSRKLQQEMTIFSLKLAYLCYVYIFSEDHFITDKQTNKQHVICVTQVLYLRCL